MLPHNVLRLLRIPENGHLSDTQKFATGKQGDAL